MSETIQTLEQQSIEELSAHYRLQGYKVNVRPQPYELPPSLSSFSEAIDLIAIKNDELVVIEVKSRVSLIGDSEVKALAQAIQENENWRFELVVVNEPGEVVDDTTGLDRNRPNLKVASGVKQTQALLTAGFDAPALVSAWAVTEAALRELALRENVAFDERPVAQLIKNLAFLGLIDEKDYELLGNALKLRNSVVHGFEAHANFKQIIDQLLLVVEEAVGN